MIGTKDLQNRSLLAPEFWSCQIKLILVVFYILPARASCHPELFSWLYGMRRRCSRLGGERLSKQVLKCKILSTLCHMKEWQLLPTTPLTYVDYVAPLIKIGPSQKLTFVLWYSYCQFASSVARSFSMLLWSFLCSDGGWILLDHSWQTGGRQKLGVQQGW